jgi:hypothetical protein
MSGTVTDTIACIGKKVLSDTTACVSKNMPVHRMVLSGVKRTLFVLKKFLQDSSERFFDSIF